MTPAIPNKGIPRLSSWRETGQEVIGQGVDLIGVNWVFRTIQDWQLLVLCYHSVVSGQCARRYGRYANLVGVSEFSRQMEELLRQFTPIAASQLPEFCAGREIPRNSVLVTFDDGYRNNLTCAAPVPRRLGIPALIFLTTGYIGRQRILWPNEILWRVVNWPGESLPMLGERGEIRTPQPVSKRVAQGRSPKESCKSLPFNEAERYLNRLRECETPRPPEELYAFLTWDEARELRDQGFAIGAHTVEHPILAQVDRQRLAYELRESRRAIERETGEECEYFAYPNGTADDITAAVVEETRAAGYRFAFTLRGQRASAEDDPLQLDRVYIAGRSSLAAFRHRISGFHETVRQYLRR